MNSQSCSLGLSEVVLSYGVVRALQSVSIDVEAGAITALVGLNGAGKSSLLKAIVGLARPSSGRITYIDKQGERRDVLGVRPWRRPQLLGLAYVPEGRGLFERMSLHENLSFGSAVGRRRAGPSAAAERWRAVVELFPWLEERGSTVVANLSGGEQQMVAIARALLMEPTVLLLDEPSIGLAPVMEEQMFDVLRRLADETGLTVLVAEQRLDVALSISDHAYLLEQGRIRAQGSPRELFADAELAAMYLGGRAAA